MKSDTSTRPQPVVTRFHYIVILLLLLPLTGQALAPTDSVRINEVYFACSINYTTDDQFIELYNAGSTTAWLDGAMIARGTDTLMTRVFAFPGNPGDQTWALPPGGFTVIAQDAFDFVGVGGDPTSVDLSGAPFETYSVNEWPPVDNPASQNLIDALDIGMDFELDRRQGGILLITGEEFVVEPCEDGG
ncbi:MAG: hypothetical protein ISR91_01210 [Candidatus Delongbacteria bacterium]|nr:hypothetical protein [Candidatus Delongbacteria bacterium]